MPRPKKKQIKLTNESAVALMQEIYNETVEQRSTAIRIQNKMLAFMKEATDMTLIGPVLKEQQKIVDSAIEKKIQLSKLISTMMAKNTQPTTPAGSLDGDMKEALNELLRNNNDDSNNPGNVKYEL